MITFPHPMFRRNALLAWIKLHPGDETHLRDTSDLYPLDIFGTHQVHNDLRVLRHEGRLR